MQNVRESEVIVPGRPQMGHVSGDFMADQGS